MTGANAPNGRGSPIERPERAIFLLAGSSRRFEGLVEHKALLRIGGQSLVERLVIGAASLGIADFVFVVGAAADRLRTEIVSLFEADRIPHRQLAFVHNARYRSTNNAASLWLASSFLDRPALLLEGDIVVDFTTLQAVRFDRSLWFGVRDFPADGSFVTHDEDGRVTDQEIIHSRAVRPKAVKSASLFAFTRDGAGQLRDALDRLVVARGGANEYIDTAIRETLRRSPIYVSLIDAARWHEIDTPADFYDAKAKFAALEDASGPPPERPLVDPALR